MRLPLGEHTATVHESTANTSRMLLEKVNALAAAQGRGISHIDGDGSTDRAKEDNDGGGS